MLLRAWGADYKAIRDSYSSAVQKVWDFDSAKKMASVLIKTPDGYRLYNKASTAALSMHMLVGSHLNVGKQELSSWLTYHMIANKHGSSLLRCRLCSSKMIRTGADCD